MSSAADYREKGNLFFRQKDMGKAWEMYSKAIELAEGNEKELALGNRAQVALELGRHQQAVSDCSVALEINPGNSKALYRRGMASYRLGDLSQALRDLKKCLHLNPDNSAAKNALKTISLATQSDDGLTLIDSFITKVGCCHGLF
jgi:tetratricopeptide (TPR) repeat protein